jgi:predicted nucleic acid-binding protein
MPVLVDTNILIDCLRRSMKAMEWFKAQSERPFISAVSLLELYAGARSQREQRDIAEIRKLVQCLPVVEQIGERSGVFMRLYGAIILSTFPTQSSQRPPSTTGSGSRR